MTPEARAQVMNWIQEKNPKPYRAEPAKDDIPAWGRIATLEERHHRACILLGQAIAGKDWGNVAAAFNLLLLGSEDGAPQSGG